MIFGGRVYSVLLVSASGKFNNSILPLLPESLFSPVITVQNVAAAKRRLLERSYDFVLINTPLGDDFGTRLAIDVCSASSAVSLLFVRSELYDDIYARVVDYGVFTLPKPTNAQVVSQSVNLLCATRERLRRIEKRTATVEEKMTEIRQVNRAKWLLIDRLKMTEEQAHKYIEKQAMDKCVSKLEIAESVIRTYS